MTHLLVTNDFPPKVGGIQSYLWELWHRIDPRSFSVLTASSDNGAASFDAEQARRGMRIERLSNQVLLPTPETVRRVRALVRETDASLVIIDPAFPLGLIGPRLQCPYGVVLHGAEVAAPARVPGARAALAHVLRGATLAICAGGYPASEARRLTGGRLGQVIEIPPGVDLDRFKPLPAASRRSARVDFGLPVDAPLIVGVSRLVPRKGMDVLVEAASKLSSSFPDVFVAIAGEGRDRSRLERMIKGTQVRAQMLGRVGDDQLPALYGCGDVFVMACRDRWFGLEQEGFGIVFLEAAAAGTPQVAGRSGGAHEAVEDGRTGFVVDDPRDPAVVALAIRRLLSDDNLRRRMAREGRRRVERSFGYDALANRLALSLESAGRKVEREDRNGIRPRSEEMEG